MEVLLTMINGLWNGLKTAIIYQDQANNLEISIADILIILFVISFAITFIKIVIVGSEFQMRGR